MKYSAVIIEPRRHKALEFVLRNISSCLSDEWGIIIMHGSLNKEYVEQIVPKINTLKNITLHDLHVENLSIHMYNLLVTSPSFYDHIPTETFLIFQTDSMIFPRNAHLLEQFMKYDYVGAPWGFFHYNIKVGNGGFSLRKKSKMLHILHSDPYVYKICNEDVYYSKRALYVPSYEQSKSFSMETVFSEQCFGCHKPWAYLDHDILFKHYPECLELYQLQSCEPIESEREVNEYKWMNSRNVLLFFLVICAALFAYQPVLLSSWDLKYHVYYGLCILLLFPIVFIYQDIML